LEDEGYRELDANHELLVDGNGFSFDTAKQRSAGGHNFERILVIYALNVAYREAMGQAVDQLARSDGDVDGLRALYRSAISFNARYFFSQPISENRTLMPMVWSAFEERFNSIGINDEFVRQLDASHRLLAAERESAEARREQKLTRRLTIFGTVIGFLSLLGLLQITPDQAAQFFTGWTNTISGWVSLITQ